MSCAISPTRLDPHATPTFFADVYYMAPVYDRLIMQRTDGGLAPMLATDWQFVEEGRALELTLRQGVTFHDGEVFNAAAVKANIERAQAQPASSQAA